MPTRMTASVAWAYRTKPEVTCIGGDGPRVCRHRHKRYGMDCVEFAALLQRAGGGCEICRVMATDTAHGYLVIDHDYAYGNGGVRGLLCSTCNTRIAYPTNVENREATGRYLANPWHLRHLARAATEGMPQKDIIEATGYSRETIRRLTAEGKKLPDA